MPTIYSRFSGETKEILNGRVVKDYAINTEYDGKTLEVAKRDKNRVSHFTIKDMRKLLAQPMSKENLMERLSKDYRITKKQKKYKKKRRTTKRRTLLKKRS
jgi:hypothetical protein